MKQRLVGLAAAVIVIAAVMLSSSVVDVSANTDLPGVSGFSESAEVSLEDSSYGEVEITDHREGYVRIHMKRLGSTVLTVKDGAETYLYKVEVINENGVSRIDVSPVSKESTGA